MNMNKNKHLILDERYVIEHSLLKDANDSKSVFSHFLVGCFYPSCNINSMRNQKMSKNFEKNIVFVNYCFEP